MSPEGMAALLGVPGHFYPKDLELRVSMEANQQAKEKPSYRRDGHLDVVKVWETIQGEGPYVGYPATFIRLAGCNLQCPLCDTDYTTARRINCPDTLVAMADRHKLVVITGGEPFRQNLGPAVTALLKAGKQVQIETNGTLYQRLPFDQVCVVCSPKTATINWELRDNIRAFKYVVESDHVAAEDGLPTRVLGSPCKVARPHTDWFQRTGRIYVQPCDEADHERNKLHVKQAIDSCMKHGYRLCLQVHKIVGLE